MKQGSRVVLTYEKNSSGGEILRRLPKQSLLVTLDNELITPRGSYTGFVLLAFVDGKYQLGGHFVEISCTH